MAKNMYQKRAERKKKALENNENNGVNKSVINWYPGHMAKTKREIKEKIDLIDIVYEVIDARMPFSSKIVDIDLVIRNKPRILIITKYDLCDKAVTDKFIDDYSSQYPIIKVDLKNNQNISKTIIHLTNEILSDLNNSRLAKGLKERVYRALVVGVPNVGKSTLINRLAGHNVTVTGNKAGVTKSLTWIRVNKNIELLDSPGILWPKIDDKIVGYNLASLTSIKEEILDKEDICRYIIDFLFHNYKETLCNKYHLLNINDNFDLVEIYDKIAKNRGCLLKGGLIDYEKVYTIVINDLKNGSIKNVTFDIYISNIFL